MGRDNSKSYSNEEFVFRWNVWKENQQLIDEHNRSNKTFFLAMNKFGDLTNAEFNKLFKGLAFDYSLHANKAAAEKAVPAPGLPADFDWRQKGAATHVKNQGQCGSCWSFSTTGSTEGANFLKTGRLTSLSEQNLIDCSGSYGNNGCNGGLMDYAFEYIINNKGIDTEASYPYQTAQYSCQYNPANSGAIDASHNSFQFYSGGVYYESACSSTQLDHGVLAVGWGTENGQDYWLVKNSWGADWGLSGYIKMARNRNNNCGIATSASYPTA